MLFDTHAHLEDIRFDDDRHTVIQRMKEVGISLCVTVGSDISSSCAASSLSSRYEGLFFAAGVHPHEAKNWQDSDAERITCLLDNPKGVAWGEIGLDYHYDFSPRTDQRVVFEKQLDAAYAGGFPTILHVREAHGDALDILEARRGRLSPIAIHCFSGSWESAKRYLDLGCRISIAGPVTFKNANKLLDVARLTPLDRLMIETDSPYLAPEPYRGSRNEPALISSVARRIAEIRGIKMEDVAEKTYSNGRHFFKIL